MGGVRKALNPACALFRIEGTTTWTAPKNGIYRFVIWAGGADGSGTVRSGGAGQLYIAERPLTKGQTVVVVSGAKAVASTVTLPTGEVLTAQPASGVTGGSGTQRTTRTTSS